MSDKRIKTKKLEKALDRLIHAFEDEIDNYDEISNACDEAKKLLPNYKQ